MRDVLGDFWAKFVQLTLRQGDGEGMWKATEKMRKEITERNYSEGSNGSVVAPDLSMINWASPMVRSANPPSQ